MTAMFREMGFPTTRAWPEGAVVYSIGRTASMLLRQLDQLYARFGLSVPSFNLLMLLKHGADPDACTQQRVGSWLVVSPSDMTGLIDRLERKGLVKRTPGRDRRSKLLRITPKGAALLNEVWPLHAEHVQRMAGILSQGEANQLLGALANVREATRH